MVTMSQKEFQRVKVIENVAGGRLSVGEASRLLQLSERQVQRLKRRYRPDSIAWVQHGNRGRSMPWALPVPQKQLILNLARGKYQGFNDSHLAEKLRAEENLAVSRETVRRILRAAKLASPQKRRPRQYRSRRPSLARRPQVVQSRRLGWSLGALVWMSKRLFGHWALEASRLALGCEGAVEASECEWYADRDEE